MGDRTGIEWTDATWNPVVGCTRVSAGCDNCYAVAATRRLEAMGQSKYAGLVNPGKDHFNGTARLHRPALDIPLRWTRGRRIFVNSLSDLFHEELTDGEISAVFGVMAACDEHTFQVLTKRPRRALAFLEMCSQDPQAWPLPNVWLGVSIEDQATADERIPLLLQTPAEVRFVSYEPALGPVNSDRHFWLTPAYRSCQQPDGAYVAAIVKAAGRRVGWAGIDWIIVGGESGGGARPFDLAWARQTVERCRAAGVPCFVKQLGANPIDSAAVRAAVLRPRRLSLRDHKGGDWSEWPEDLRVREFPGAPTSASVEVAT